MGEIADMMLDGTLCEGCGTYIGEGSGFPGYCSTQCAKDRGFDDQPTTDAECIDYLNNVEFDEPATGPFGDQAVVGLRVFMGVGKKRAKRLVAQWRASK